MSTTTGHTPTTDVPAKDFTDVALTIVGALLIATGLILVVQSGAGTETLALSTAGRDHGVGVTGATTETTGVSQAAHGSVGAGPSPVTLAESATTAHDQSPDQSPAPREEPAAPSATEPADDAPSTSNPDPAVALADHEQRGRNALARIGYDWQNRLAGWTIEFHPERSGFYGLTMVDEKRIEVYVRSDQPNGLLAHVIAHEIGHAVDVTLNSSEDRERWQQARGIADAPWWPSPAATDFSTGAGDFAEAFAAWQTGASSFRSNLGAVPTADQLALLAELSAG